MQGKLIVISAPSGAGKTTLVKKLIASRKDLEFSISACTRKKRNNETNGVDYYFVTTTDFKNKIKNNEFLEWEEVYPNCFYGTLKAEVQRIWNNSKHVVFDVDVKGGLKIKEAYPEQTLSIFVKPPSLKELKQRLKNRNTESDESLFKRIEKAKYELSFEKDFDVVVINDTLEKAEKEVIELAASFINNIK